MQLHSAYMEHFARIQSDRVKMNQEEALAEKCRQQWAQKKDEWTRVNEQKMAKIGLEMFCGQRKEADDMVIARAFGQLAS